MKSYKRDWQDYVQRQLPEHEYALSVDRESMFGNKSVELAYMCSDDLYCVIEHETGKDLVPELAEATARRTAFFAEKIKRAKRHNPYAHMTSWNEQAHQVLARWSITCPKRAPFAY